MFTYCTIPIVKSSPISSKCYISFFFPQSLSSREILGTGPRLVLPSASPSDEGVYVCRAENEAGAVEAGASLSVHGEDLCLLNVWERCLSVRLSVCLFGFGAQTTGWIPTEFGMDPMGNLENLFC